MPAVPPRLSRIFVPAPPLKPFPIVGKHLARITEANPACTTPVVSEISPDGFAMQLGGPFNVTARTVSQQHRSLFRKSDVYSSSSTLEFT